MQLSAGNRQDNQNDESATSCEIDLIVIRTQK